MDKIIIFDWGGVILKEYPEHYCDQDAIIETIKKFNNNLTDNDAYQLYLDTLKDENNRKISIFNDYESKYKWYERIHNNGKLNTTYEEFINEFTYNYNKIDKYEEVVNYIYTLKDKTNLVLFSDLIFACFSALENTINLNIFDKIFLSYEEGYVKSNIEAFINVEKKLNIKAENILFIDNNENNINNAKKRGWNTCLAFGYELDKIKNTVQIRTRRPGDRIQVQSGGGHKKLKDYLIDSKIPQNQRDSLVLLADGKEIIWVVGMRISEAYKITQETKRILSMCVNGGEEKNE